MGFTIATLILNPPFGLWMTALRSSNPLYTAGISVALWTLVKFLMGTRWQMTTTRLRGPPSTSIIYGVSNDLISSKDASIMYELWAKEYGVVYRIPTVLGRTNIVLCDPKAIAHYYARETWTYLLTPFSSTFIEDLVGKGLLLAEGESHKRQRKTLAPALSNTAIRKLTSVFYDSAYKAKIAWDAIIESSNEDNAVIEVQNWMNHIALDTIGIAGFSHDFGSLDGKHSIVAEQFDTLGKQPGISTLGNIPLLLSQVIPIMVKFPTEKRRSIRKLNATMGAISNDLLIRGRQEKDLKANEIGEGKSIMGLLIKAEDQDVGLYPSSEEALAQMKTILVAGYETTSISLTWALIVLSQHPDVQTRLREELLAFGLDPTHDQLKTNLPYLDAVVHEILRLHPPITEFTHIAASDDVIPLSEHVCTASGELTESVSVAKGTLITIPAKAINCSSAIWGPDARQFNPNRWITENSIDWKFKEVRGHRHLLTFVDGPRTCLGKDFAIAEFKVVLLVLVKNFVFEMRDGRETTIEISHDGILPRPLVIGEDGSKVPLRVRRYE